jgi:hypothetical protein
MGKTITKFTVEAPKRRNGFALDAMMRKADKMKDRREPRKGSRNWKHEYLKDDE